MLHGRPSCRLRLEARPEYAVRVETREQVVVVGRNNNEPVIVHNLPDPRHLVRERQRIFLSHARLSRPAAA